MSDTLRLFMRCIRCNEDSLDLRYFYNGTNYELEYHCTTLQGGCDFYRVISLELTQKQLIEFESRLNPCGVVE